MPFGIDPHVNMRRLGYSDVAATLRIHQRTTDELREKIADPPGEPFLGRKNDLEDAP